MFQNVPPPSGVYVCVCVYPCTYARTPVHRFLSLASLSFISSSSSSLHHTYPYPYACMVLFFVYRVIHTLFSFLSFLWVVIIIKRSRSRSHSLARSQGAPPLYMVDSRLSRSKQQPILKTRKPLCTTKQHEDDEGFACNKNRGRK